MLITSSERTDTIISSDTEYINNNDMCTSIRGGRSESYTARGELKQAVNDMTRTWSADSG